MHRDLVMVVAGHIDHGKTTLVYKLTGVYTDRLAEEQRRGMTIELGFAPLELPDGRRISFIDVPGHERLVHTMIAGASGVDAFLLVVAADEGIMPQTEEHLDICLALGLETGAVAMTKIDRVDNDWRELTMEIIREYLEKRGLAHLPIVPVSGITGEGLDELIKALMNLIPSSQQMPPAYPRLPIDRAFTLSGVGTVVTGTLRGGTIHVGDKLMVYPEQIPVTVRSIQTHQENKSSAQAGQRVALNLQGVHFRSLYRGQWIAPPGTLSVAQTWLAWVHWDKDISFPQNRSRFRFHFHHGTRATVGQIIRLTQAESYGEFTLITTPEPTSARAGDRFILRRLSPVRYAGWGMLIMPVKGKGRFLRKKRRYSRWVNWPSMSWPERFSVWISLSPYGGRTMSELVRWSGWEPQVILDTLDPLIKKGKLIVITSGQQTLFLSHPYEERYREKALKSLHDFFEAHPLRSAMSTKEWYQSWRPPGIPDELVESFQASLSKRWVQMGLIQMERERVVDPNLERPPEEQIQQSLQEALKLIQKGGVSGITLTELQQLCEKSHLPLSDVVQVLQEQFDIVLMKTESAPILVHRSYIERFYQFLCHNRERKELTFQDFKAFLEASRRIVLAYLGYARDQGWLLKLGDKHRIKV